MDNSAAFPCCTPNATAGAGSSSSVVARRALVRIAYTYADRQGVGTRLRDMVVMVVALLLLDLTSLISAYPGEPACYIEPTPLPPPRLHSPASGSLSLCTSSDESLQHAHVLSDEPHSTGYSDCDFICGALWGCLLIYSTRSFQDRESLDHLISLYVWQFVLL
jgi:hypothetical protein